jgi:flagellar protein FlgJ
MTDPVLPGMPATAQMTRDRSLMQTATALEASFLSEMLKSAGLGPVGGAFGGGTGEDQFASFLRQAQAEEIARAGGIGLAEHIFEALKERADGNT